MAKESVAFYAFSDTTLKRYKVFEKQLTAPLELPQGWDTSPMPALLNGPTTVTLARLLAESAGAEPNVDDKSVDEVLEQVIRAYPIIAVVRTCGDETRMVTADLFRNGSTIATPIDELMKTVMNIIMKISDVRGYPIHAHGVSMYEIEIRRKADALASSGRIKNAWKRLCGVFSKRA